jgi:acyl carrier protein
MQKDSVVSSIRSFVSENYLFGETFNLADSDSFLESGIIDSTGVLQLVTHLEEAYGITVEDAELIPENLDSVDAVVAYLKRKMNGNGHAHFGAISESAVTPA